MYAGWTAGHLYAPMVFATWLKTGKCAAAKSMSIVFESADLATGD